MIPHHTVEGATDAPAVVFSNSLGTTLDMWRPQVEALADRFRLIRYDTRGHGRTPTGDEPLGIGDLSEDIGDLLDGLGVERAHLVGISLGGATVLDFAARHPERAGRIAVMCTAARIATPQYWADRVKQVRTSGMAELVDPAMRRWFTDRFRSEHPPIVKRFRSGLAACDPLGYAACCRALGEMDLGGALAAIKAPTLVLYGTEDAITTGADAMALASGLPDCRAEAVQEAKHLASVEQAAFVNRRIIEHLGMEREAHGR